MNAPGGAMAFHFDLVDLQLFANIVDTQSLTRGAERSHLSAPAASARIKKLEDALCVQLFYRTAQGLAPTSSGQTLLQHARQVLRQIERLDADLRRGSANIRGNIRVFANTLSISEFIPVALERFLIAFPEVNIDLHERTTPDIARAVRQGEADIGILSGDAGVDGLDLLPYRSERLVLITCAGHGLAGEGEVDFSRVLNEDYIGLKEGTALHAFIDRAAAQQGVRLKVRIRVSNFEALCSLVASGIGVGLIPESVARRHAGRLAIEMVRLRDGWALRRLQIAVRSADALSVPARALIEELRAPVAA